MAKWYAQMACIFRRRRRGGAGRASVFFARPHSAHFFSAGDPLTPLSFFAVGTYASSCSSKFLGLFHRRRILGGGSLCHMRLLSSQHTFLIDVSLVTRKNLFFCTIPGEFQALAVFALLAG